MRQVVACAVVFLAGFSVMVLEIVGARYLAKDFGGSFYVWISQIGVILVALGVGYYAGGRLADRHPRVSLLVFMLVPAGVVTLLIPEFAAPLLDWIVNRHPLDLPIPAVWQKLDPVLGSTLIFFLPCAGLATPSPFLIRWASLRLSHVGEVSGLVYAAGAVGSIAGVFVSGYVLIDHFALSTIFRGTGLLTVGLGLMCLAVDRSTRSPSRQASAGPARNEDEAFQRRLP